MTLANVAELFYRAGLKVLMVDWDLEAPGLDRFFFGDKEAVEEVLDKPGVIEMLLDYKDQMSQDFSADEKETFPFKKPKDLILDIYPNSEGKGKLYLLTAGRRSKRRFSEYANSVLSFDWKDFYNNWDGELYFEWLRGEFERDVDAVLIDSRTGVTEMGGVCTYQFADVIVAFCSPNKQNLEGIYEMVQKFKNPDVIKLRNERPLEVLIIPSRVEDRAETEQLNEFRQEFNEKFSDFAPKAIGDGPESLWRLMIPYVPYFAFNEIIAVREQGKKKSDDMNKAFRSIANAMAIVGSLGNIFETIGVEKDYIDLQNLRDFTVQIRNQRDDTIVGTGIVISIDGKILTCSQVVLDAIGVNPADAEDRKIAIFFPQVADNDRERYATVLSFSADLKNDIVLLQLEGETIPIRNDQIAYLGIADKSSNHFFRSYGYSVSSRYDSRYSSGKILGGVDLSRRDFQRFSPLELETSKDPLDMPGAAVLDLELNLVVGIISGRQSMFYSDDEKTTALAENLHVLSFDPLIAKILLNTGDAYLTLGRYGEAIDVYKEALEKNSHLNLARIGLGMAYYRQGRYKDAIDAYLKSIEENPKLSQSWIGLGKIYAKLNEHRNAIDACKQALSIDPESASIWSEIGNIYSEIGKYRDAVSSYKKSIEIDPNVAMPWEKLGDIYKKQCLCEEAIEAYNNAIKTDQSKASDILLKKEECEKATMSYENRLQKDKVQFWDPAIILRFLKMYRIVPLLIVAMLLSTVLNSILLIQLPEIIDFQKKEQSEIAGSIPSLPAIKMFKADPMYIIPGESTTLSWVVQGADSVAIEDIGVVAPNGSLQVSPDDNTAYILTARNAIGSTTSAINLKLIDLVSDENNCGSRGNNCPGGMSCENGNCVCPSGKADCNGACVDLTSDKNNCGSCGNNCPSGMSCENGNCVCSSGKTDCNGACIDLASDKNNCGSCVNNCPSGMSCENGNCVCPSGKADCNGACVDLTSDKNNCGSCGNNCPSGMSCENGNCVCPSGKTDCNGACIDLASDENNCGSCGNKCIGNISCENGNCLAENRSAFWL